MSENDSSTYNDILLVLLVGVVLVGVANTEDIPGYSDFSTLQGSDFSDILYPQSTDFVLTDTEEFEIEETGNYAVRFAAEAETSGNSLNLSVDGETVLDHEASRFRQRFSLPFREIEEGSTITLESYCDSNCGDIDVKGFRIIPFEDQPENILYARNRWYTETGNEDRVWGKDNSSVHIYNYEETARNKTMRVYLASFPETRNITYIFNDEKLGERVVPARNYRLEFRQEDKTVHPESYPVDQDDFEGTMFHRTNKYHFNVTLEPGENILEFTTDEDCVTKGDVNENNDLRCSSFGFQDLYFVDESFSY